MRLRPPKQGELRTDVSKATMFQGDKGGEKAHGVCCPGRDKGFFVILFVPYKKYGKVPGRERLWRLCRRKKHTECAVPAGTNFLRSGKFQKDLILLVESCCLGELIQGLQNLGTPCERDVFTFFLRRAKRTKKHARGLRTSGLRGAIQSSAGSDFAKFSGGSCRNRFCPQNAGVKALNRCERITVVQTQD